MVLHNHELVRAEGHSCITVAARKDVNPIPSKAGQVSSAERSVHGAPHSLHGAGLHLLVTHTLEEPKGLCPGSGLAGVMLTRPCVPMGGSSRGVVPSGQHWGASRAVEQTAELGTAQGCREQAAHSGQAAAQLHALPQGSWSL